MLNKGGIMQQAKLTVLCVDGNVFINGKHIVSNVKKGMDIASNIVEVLEDTLGKDAIDFQFNSPDFQ